MDRTRQMSGRFAEEDEAYFATKALLRTARSHEVYAALLCDYASARWGADAVLDVDWEDLALSFATMLGSVFDPITGAQRRYYSPDR